MLVWLLVYGLATVFGNGKAVGNPMNGNNGNVNGKGNVGGKGNLGEVPVVDDLPGSNGGELPADNHVTQICAYFFLFFFIFHCINNKIDKSIGRV
jgi:hypothetical protein